MSPSRKVLIGGFGALTPIVLNLLIVDLETVWLKVTVFAALGYFIRVVTLFYLGGMFAWLHKREDNPVKLFELGIVAPALVTGVLNGAAAKPARTALGLFGSPTLHASGRT